VTVLNGAQAPGVMVSNHEVGIVISKVRGDILLSDAQAIAHGVGPHDHFNQGLALVLRERHPAMAKDFRHYCHQENPKAGHAWLWAAPERVVINLMTQEPAPDNKAYPGKATLHNVSTRLPTPIAAKASPMPTDQRLRSDDRKSLQNRWKQRYSWTMNQRSPLLRRTGPGTLRRKMFS
jgi:hypothetical protein